MALIIEDGSVVANANSYVTRAAYIAYAASIGVTIVSDATADEQLVKAAMFIDRHEANFHGTRSTRDQDMAFPRFGLPLIDGWYWTTSEIPTQLIKAQCEYALDINAAIDLYNRPANPNMVASSERVEGAIDVSYAVGQGSQNLLRESAGDALLLSLLMYKGGASYGITRT